MEQNYWYIISSFTFFLIAVCAVFYALKVKKDLTELLEQSIKDKDFAMQKFIDKVKKEKDIEKFFNEVISSIDDFYKTVRSTNSRNYRENLAMAQSKKDKTIDKFKKTYFPN